MTTELAFQRAQRAKREATDALARRRRRSRQAIYHGASLGLRELDVSDAAAETAAEIGDEVRILEELAVQAKRDRCLPASAPSPTTTGSRGSGGGGPEIAQSNSHALGMIAG